MHKITPTPSQITEAYKLFDFKRLNNSITGGDGNVSGALGEIVVRDTYKGKQANTYDYDIILNGKKVDVKTKRFSKQFTPNKNWTFSVADYNTTQKCDYYCFVGVSYDLSTVYILGFMKKSDFIERSVFRRKGEVDPNGNGTWTFRADCHNIQVKDLIL
jgi:hypothetical protein